MAIVRFNNSFDIILVEILYTMYDVPIHIRERQAGNIIFLKGIGVILNNRYSDI